MNINKWLHMYISMIVYPITVNKNSGWALSNNMRILFTKDATLTAESKTRLIRHYKKIGVLKDDEDKKGSRKVLENRKKET